MLTEHLERLRQQQAVVMELIAAQHQNPNYHHPSHAAHPLSDAAGRHMSASQFPSAISLLDPAAYPGQRRGSAHDAAHLPPPVPRHMSHADGVTILDTQQKHVPWLSCGAVQRPRFFAVTSDSDHA